MLKDLIIAFKNKDLWVYLSWYDVVAKYRRTSLGPFWGIILTAVSILCMSVLGSILFKAQLKEFLPYVACGMVIWGYIGSIITESCTVFLSHSGLIQNVRLPLLAFSLRMFLRNTILFLHSLVILLCVIIFGSTISMHLFFLIPAFLIFAINAISLSIILGFFASRYRDVVYIIQALLNILVLLSPVMWKVEMLREYSYLANINPITHFIALFRQPLLGREIDMFTLQYVGAATIIGVVIAQYLYSRFKNRLVFWL